MTMLQATQAQAGLARHVAGTASRQLAPRPVQRAFCWPAQLPRPASTPGSAQAAARQAGAITCSALASPLGAASSQQATQFDKEVVAAVEAVRLASKLCQAVQLELKAGEKQEKGDASPVTVADYGAQVRGRDSG